MDLHRSLSHEEKKHLLSELFGYSIGGDGTVYDDNGEIVKVEKDSFGVVIGEFKTLSDFFYYQNHIGYEFGLFRGKTRLQSSLKKLLFE